jgi:hypothetical protein
MTEQQFLEIGRLFDSQEKWDAFVELCYKKDPLRHYWFNNTIDAVEQLVLNHPGHNGWKLIRGDFWIRLSPVETGQESLSIHIDFWGRWAGVWINANLHNPETVVSLLEEYSSGLLPALPGFVTNNEPWVPMTKTIPADIINYEKDPKTFDSFMYTWNSRKDAVAKRIFDEFFESVLNPAILVIFKSISLKARKQE